MRQVVYSVIFYIYRNLVASILIMDYFEAKCNYCPQTFLSKISLKKHLFNFHMVCDVSHECDECHKNFKTKSQLNLHRRNQHIKKTCDLCNNRKDKTTLASGEATLAGIVHFNSVNI